MEKPTIFSAADEYLGVMAPIIEKIDITEDDIKASDALKPDMVLVDSKTFARRIHEWLSSPILSKGVYFSTVKLLSIAIKYSRVLEALKILTSHKDAAVKAHWQAVDKFVKENLTGTGEGKRKDKTTTAEFLSGSASLAAYFIFVRAKSIYDVFENSFVGQIAWNTRLKIIAMHQNMKRWNNKIYKDGRKASPKTFCSYAGSDHYPLMFPQNVQMANEKVIGSWKILDVNNINIEILAMYLTAIKSEIDVNGEEFRAFVLEYKKVDEASWQKAKNGEMEPMMLKE